MIALAQLPIFPCNLAKEPLSVHGFKSARRGAKWKGWPLVGFPTGAASGIDVLDIDPTGLRYVKTFRGLEYATEESIASFLYDDMHFIPKLAPEGNKFRGSQGGPRGWEFPPLLELREIWATLHGGQWDWHNPEIDEWQRSSGME
jgi:hypothetical protein